MENFIKKFLVCDKNKGENMAKVLIATLYHAEPVYLASNKLGAERLYLIIDDKPDKTQEKNLKEIKNSIGKVVDIMVVKVPLYDIVGIAAKVVEVIDLIPKEDAVYMNITSSRKTVALGSLFAAYARCDRVRKIGYQATDPKGLPLVYLPKLSFDLTESQKRVLECIEEGDYKTHAELAKKISISTAMLYRNIKELEDLDLVSIDEKEGFQLTDAGRIARL